MSSTDVRRSATLPGVALIEDASAHEPADRHASAHPVVRLAFAAALFGAAGVVLALCLLLQA